MIVLKTKQAETVDEVISELLEREREIWDYYRYAISKVGPDAETTVHRLGSHHRKHIDELEALLIEIRELRELCAPIAD